jgi:hypothetical protein
MEIEKLKTLWSDSYSAWVLPTNYKNYHLNDADNFDLVLIIPFVEVVSNLQNNDNNDYNDFVLPYSNVFELTAFEPALFQSYKPSIDENMVNLARLKDLIYDYLLLNKFDIQIGTTGEIKSSKDSVGIWSTFGFDIDGHREDGIAIGIDNNNNQKFMELKSFILTAGKDFGQGAIYEYKYDNDSKSVKRFTIPCCSTFDLTYADMKVFRTFNVPINFHENIYHPTKWYSNKLQDTSLINVLHPGYSDLKKKNG